MEQLSDECRRAVKQFTSSYRRGKIAEQRTQLTRALWACIVVWVGHGVYLVLEGQGYLAYTQFFGVAGTVLALVLLLRTGKVALSAWTLAVTLTLTLAVSAALTQGLGSASSWFLSFPVMLSVPFVTAKSIRWMCVLPFSVLGGLALVRKAGVIPELSMIPDEFVIYAQLQMAVLYTLFCHYSTKLGEREMTSLAQQREKSDLEATRASKENEKKTRFLAKMSHELRTPMNGLLGMIQYLETRSLPRESQTYLSRLKKRSEHILEHINDALDLTQVDAGDGAKRVAQFDLRRMISKICDVQTQFGSREDCALDVTIDLDALGYLGDHRRLRHLLSTIVGTAFQDSADGVVHFRVWNEPSAANQTSAGAENVLSTPVRFEVSYVGKDRGAKVEPDQADLSLSQSVSITESSFILHTNTGSQVPGRNDLSSKFSSAFRVSELLGGSFFIAREEGKVVRACAHIPLQATTVPVQSANSLPTMCLNSVVPQSRYVLVVDDNAINLKVACLLLQKLGCKCDTANDGVEAVELARKNRYDAVFMDLRMPNMDGFEATRQIIAGWETQDESFPIMALTANAYDEDVSKALDAGMVTHISKPVDATKLQEVLETYVSGPTLSLQRLQRTGS